MAKGAVGRTTPNLTGVIKESAVSHNSMIASLCKVWKTLKQHWMCLLEAIDL